MKTDNQPTQILAGLWLYIIFYHKTSFMFKFLTMLCINNSRPFLLLKSAKNNSLFSKIKKQLFFPFLGSFVFCTKSIWYQDVSLTFLHPHWFYSQDISFLFIDCTQYIQSSDTNMWRLKEDWMVWCEWNATHFNPPSLYF